MKKMLISILIFAICIGSTSCYVLANEMKDNKCILNNEITDEKVLLYRAKNEINDAPQEHIDYILSNTEIEIDGVLQDVEPLVTTQLIEKSFDNSGNMEAEYAATVITDAEIITDKNGVAVLSTSNYSKTENKLSQGKDVRLYTTIYYTMGTYNKIDYIKLTKVTAKSELVDTSCRIPYTKVRGGYRGYNLATKNWDDKTFSWVQKSGFSSSSTISGAMLEATPGGILYSVWGEAYCQIKRGTQTWSFSMKVYEAGAGSVL